MTASQLNVFNAIKDAVEGRSRQKQIFIKARGGTGKTFLLNRMLYYIRLLSDDAIALSVAFTGIAATLLQGGRTFNSRFKYKINADAADSCNISKGTGLAKLIKRAKIIVWDEAPMSDKILLEALDRLLQDLMDSNEPFGGKIVVLGGDFRQLPTVKKRESRAQIVNASIIRSPLWDCFKAMTLEENMTIQNNGNHPKLIEFDNWLQKLGDGKLETHPGTDYVTLPDHLCSEIVDGEQLRSQDDAIKFVYGNIATQSALQDWP